MAVTNCLYPPPRANIPPGDDILVTKFPNRVVNSDAFFACSRVRDGGSFTRPRREAESSSASWKWITGDGDGNLFGGTTMADRTTGYIGDTDPAVIPPPSPWWQSRVNSFTTTYGSVSVERCSKMWVTNSTVRHNIFTDPSTSPCNLANLFAQSASNPVYSPWSHFIFKKIQL